MHRDQTINIRLDPMRIAVLFGREVLFTPMKIPAEDVPSTWYRYDIRGTIRDARRAVALQDHSYVNRIGSVLSPVPLKRESTISRRVNGQFFLFGESMTLLEYCHANALEYPFPMTCEIRPASVEEAGLFYTAENQDTALGTVGHLRMDFGADKKGFWSSWWPHNGDQFNTPEFKEALQEFVEAMRKDGPLKDLASMQKFCCQNSGAITEDGRSYGYIGETENYRFCLRCTPRPGEYQGYLYCYDLRQQELARQSKLVGWVTFANGDLKEFTDAEKYLQAIREELPYRDTTGFRFETLTDDPQVRKAVDDILLDFAGEENPRRACNYGLTEAGHQALRDAADPRNPHTYAWFVMTDCGAPEEQIHRDLTLEEAIQFYQDSDRPEKRLGVTKDGIATVDMVRSLDGEQQFFEDFHKLESFWNDLVISAAVGMLHREFDVPEESMKMGGF